MAAREKKIALMRPKLPVCDAIYPYLKEIDNNRWYSNFGPLARQLEKEMCTFFRMPPDCVLTVGNGTTGLSNILRALDIKRGGYVLLPSWTFIATPAAVLSAGFVPYFIDVDESTWALDPAVVRKYLRELGDKVSAVMVVAPLGAPLDTKAWDAITEETDVPVIIDAAAAFDSFSTVPTSAPGKSPVMISFHATKSFGVGEGGIIVSSNAELVNRICEMSNFGFNDSRIVSIPGTNGKMSEYHAAVGLAALDGWSEKRETLLRLKKQYAEAFEEAGLPVYAHCLQGDWVSSTLNVRVADGTANQVIRYMNEAGIESRKWWGNGCHAQPAYMVYPRAELPNTEALGDSVLALPFTLDMARKDIELVTDTLQQALQQDNLPKRAYA